MYSAPSRRSTTPSATLRGATPISGSTASSVGAPSRRLDTSTQPMSPHRSIQAAWKAGTTMEGVQVPASPSYGKKLEEESKQASSPSNTSHLTNPMYARPLSSQTAVPVSRMSIDPFAKATGRSAISTAPTSPGTSRPSSAPGGGRPATSGSSAFAAAQPLPPHLSHLYFPAQTFPPFLLHIASRVFFAKMRDLNITTANLEKERRFVWLVCRQSMGAGLNSHVNNSTASAVSTTAVSMSSPTNKNANMVEAGYMSLRIPDASLGTNALREVCSFLAYDTRFAHLQLSGNTLGDDGASLLAQMLARNSNLTSLDLRATGLGQGAFSMLLDSLIEHPSVTALDASSLKSEGRMFMGLKGAKSLSKVLRKNTLLRKLHLSNTGIVAESIGPIVKGLTFNRNLTSLDLSQNELSQRHMSKFGEAFASCFTLQALYLSENNIGTIGCVILGESLRKMENLKKLDLRRNNIGLKGLSLITDVIGDMISLQELYLDGNNFNENNRGSSSLLTPGSSGGANSSAAQSMNDALLREDFKHRDYVDNILKRLHIMDKRISPRLLLNSALHTFSLDSTQIGDRLMEDLAKILSNHKGLQSLHVSHNNLTDLGGRSISELIKHSSSLQNVHVDSNGIADAGGSLICLALCTPSSAVNYLSMKVNNVGKNTATALLAALARKKSLHVDLTGNKIPWVLYSKLLELSSKNKRVFEASLSERYQAEWEKLHQRHEYRLSVEEEVTGSIDELKELQDELAQIESTHVAFMEAEEAETKRMQADLHEWNHKLHETRDIESRAEHDMNNHIKDLDGKVMALRKGIEKEQRFIISAEKLIPQTIEDTEKAIKETDASTADVRRDLRLYTTDRNVEYDSCLSLKADLMRLLRELESKIKKPAKSGSNKKSSTPNSPSASTKRPASSKSKRSSTGVPKSPSNANPPAASGAPTARPGTSKSRNSTSPRSKQSTRPPSAVSRAESSLANNASSTSIGSSVASKQKSAASAAAPATPKARAATAPLKKRVGTAKKKKAAVEVDQNEALQKLLMKDSPESIAAQLSTPVPPPADNTTLSPEITSPTSAEPLAL